LIKEPRPVFIEIGPGRDLNTLLTRHKQGDGQTGIRAVNLIKPVHSKTPDDHYFLNKLGQLWTFGVKIDWQEFHKGRQSFRIPLPLYPFEGRRYWLDTDSNQAGATMMGNSLAAKKKDMGDWFYTQQWLRTALTAGEEGTPAPGTWLVFSDDTPLGNRLVKRLEEDNHHVVVVKTGESFCQLEPGEYAVNPSKPEDYDNLFKTLAGEGKTPGNIVHLWCLPETPKPDPGAATPEPVLELGLFSLLAIAGTTGSVHR
jgi:polyketide synthase PksJ